MKTGKCTGAGPIKTQAPVKLEIPSCVLMRGARTVVIIHRGERYTLRNTANNKLILTK